MIAPPRNAGFSLAEVLVAFAILALALLSIFQSFGFAARSTMASDQERVALAVARSLLATTGVTGPLRTQSARDELPGGLVWTRNVTPFGGVAGADVPSAYKVTVQVTWPRMFGRSGELALTTIKLGRAL